MGCDFGWQRTLFAGYAACAERFSGVEFTRKECFKPRLSTIWWSGLGFGEQNGHAMQVLLAIFVGFAAELLRPVSVFAIRTQSALFSFRL